MVAPIRAAVRILLLVTLTTGATASHAQVIQSDSLALVAFYNKTDGPNWNKQTNWLNGPVGTWQGINVAEGRVKTMFIIEDKLTGPIPAEIGELTGLTFINIDNNDLSGPIPPEIGNLTELQTLILSENGLDGIPDEMANLTKLQNLLIDYDEFTGPIPAWLADLADLDLLFLNHNHFSGPIPPGLGNLSNLVTLELSQNELTGAIPPELGSLAHLDSLKLQDNQLEGSVPTEFGQLGPIQSLDVSNNNLEGPLPQSLTSLHSLVRFGFSNTSICEPPDQAFQDWLSGIPDLESSGITCTATSTESAGNVQSTFRLETNYPNPFSSGGFGTTIAYSVPSESDVKITIFDALGRAVETLGTWRRTPGTYTVTWEARDHPSGLYFYRLEAGDVELTRSMFLVK